jgi:hypothetical protein
MAARSDRPRAGLVRFGRLLRLGPLRGRLQVFPVHATIQGGRRLMRASWRGTGDVVVHCTRPRVTLWRHDFRLAAGRPGVPGSLVRHRPMMRTGPRDRLTYPGAGMTPPSHSRQRPTSCLLVGIRNRRTSFATELAVHNEPKAKGWRWTGSPFPLKEPFASGGGRGWGPSIPHIRASTLCDRDRRSVATDSAAHGVLGPALARGDLQR